METQSVFVGVDVGKFQVDVACSNAEEVWTLSNDEEGIGELVVRLKTLAPELVVMEATGGFEFPAAAALAAADIQVVIANPRHCRAFLKSTEQLAKTDRIDARGLADSRFSPSGCVLRFVSSRAKKPVLWGLSWPVGVRSSR